MKAGEYCIHLEETLNKYYDGEEILLWENKLARDSNQTLFEGAFFTMVYGINFILIYVIGYSSIIKSVFNGFLRDEIAIGIIISYYAAILFSLLFLAIFGSVATKRIMMLLLTIVLLAPTALMPLIYHLNNDVNSDVRIILSGGKGEGYETVF